MLKLLQITLLPLILVSCYFGQFLAPASEGAAQVEQVPMSISEGFMVELHAGPLAQINPDKLQSKRLKSIVTRIQSYFKTSEAQIIRFSFVDSFKIDLAKVTIAKSPNLHSEVDGIAVCLSDVAGIRAAEAKMLRDIVYDLEVLIGEGDELNIGDLYTLRSVFSEAKFANRLALSIPERKFEFSGIELYVKDRLIIEFVSSDRIQTTGLYIRKNEHWLPTLFAQMKDSGLEFEYDEPDEQRFTHEDEDLDSIALAK